MRASHRAAGLVILSSIASGNGRVLGTFTTRGEAITAALKRPPHGELLAIDDDEGRVFVRLASEAA